MANILIINDCEEIANFLKLVFKDHDHEVKDDSGIRLDPNTFLASL